MALGTPRSEPTPPEPAAAEHVSMVWEAVHCLTSRPLSAAGPTHVSCKKHSLPLHHSSMIGHTPQSPSYPQAPSLLLTNSPHCGQNRNPLCHCHLIPSDTSAKRDHVTNPLCCWAHTQGMPCSTLCAEGHLGGSQAPRHGAKHP